LALDGPECQTARRPEENPVPTYQYSCTECGHFFEQFQTFSEDSLTVCPQCEGRLRKVFNAVGVVFKGSGFYRTDSRTDGRKGEKSEAAAGTSGGSADKAPATKGDSGSGAGSTSGSGSGSGNGSGSGSGSSTSATPSSGSSTSAA
jgi:putative FmdB family regulatory protein